MSGKMHQRYMVHLDRHIIWHRSKMFQNRPVVFGRAVRQTMSLIIGCYFETIVGWVHAPLALSAVEGLGLKRFVVLVRATTSIF